MRSRGGSRIVQAALDVKDWIRRQEAGELTPDAVRPARCSSCDSASRPVGNDLVLHGHGWRPRGVLGPDLLESGAATAVGWSLPAPEILVIKCRRYRCTQCWAVTMVVPRGLLRRYRYGLAAIAVALVLWTLHHGGSASRVRGQVSPMETMEAGWPSLVRWAQVAARGELLSGLDVGDQSRPPKSLAKAVATKLLGYVPPGLSGAPAWARAVAIGAHLM